MGFRFKSSFAGSVIFQMAAFVKSESAGAMAMRDLPRLKGISRGGPAGWSNSVLTFTVETSGFLSKTARPASSFRNASESGSRSAWYTPSGHFSAPVTDPSGVLTNSDGAQPMAGLVTDGHTLYGTTYEGGAFGKGTVFSLQTDGTGFTVLKHFSGSDGKTPYAELTIADNVLYGTTAGGGVSNKGAVFRLNTDGSDFTVLKSFTTNDGVLLLDGLALSDGTLYGTTYYGGSANAGTVFSMSTEGTGFTRLKEFTGADGAQPRFTLVLSGNSLYGTTEGSGDLSNAPR